MCARMPGRLYARRSEGMRGQSEYVFRFSFPSCIDTLIYIFSVRSQESIDYRLNNIFAEIDLMICYR